VGHDTAPGIAESEHKILLTASRPNLIPRVELGQNVKRRDFRGKVAGRACGWERWRSIVRWVVGTVDPVEINLSVDGSPRSRIRVYICTYSTPSPPFLFQPSPFQLFTAPTVTRPRLRPSLTSYCRFAPRSGKDCLINLAALVINSTLVAGATTVLTSGTRRQAGALTAMLGICVDFAVR
jgi:hypothetical protein